MRERLGVHGRLRLGFECYARAWPACAVLLLLLSGCTGSSEEGEAKLARSTEAAVIERVLSYSLPPLTASQSVAIGATRSLSVRDRSRVRLPNGSSATVANLAAGTTSIGVSAQVGNVWSVPSVLLQENAAVSGFLKTSGTLTPKDGSTVSGGVTEQLPITPEQRTRHVVFPTATQPVAVEKDQQRTLAPGSYLALTVKSQAKLTLSAGSYYFQSLLFEPQAEIRLNKTAGPIFIYVLDSFIHRGTFVDGGGKLANALFGYFGTVAAAVEAPFLGTLIAPNAKITLATVPAPGHRGAFFGKDVELAPDTTVWLHPFGVTVEPRWNVPSAANESFLDLAVQSSGGALAATAQSVLAIQANGTSSQVFSGNPTADSIFLNRTGTHFGVSNGANVTLRRADGTSVRNFTRAHYEYSVFVPGSDTVFSPELSVAHDRAKVTQTRLVNAAGTQLARFATPGLEVSRLSSTHLFYSTPTQLVKVTHAGVEAWRVNAALLTFEISQGARLIGKLRDGVSVQHFVNGVAQPAVAIGQPVFRIAISPSGTYSTVATQKALQLFRNGLLVNTVTLPIQSVTALTVSDRGETLLGAVLAASGRRAFLIDAGGEVLWDQVLAADSQAFRPGLSFLPNGEGFLAREAARVAAFNINRAL
jgi:hypothetical protein